MKVRMMSDEEEPLTRKFLSIKIDLKHRKDNDYPGYQGDY